MGSVKTFDRQFGKAFFETLPASPGIYRFFNEAGDLIYVGKAKNLKRRLSQYRNAKRRKAHAKMRKIVADAFKLEFEICANEIDALKLENSVIQSHRPKWNVAGAFYFLYPMVGVKIVGDELFLCYTTTPACFPGFIFHGAFRSRERTREGFFALMELLRLIGHPVAKGKLPKPVSLEGVKKPGYVYGFRQIPPEWFNRLESFFRGEDFTAIEELSVLLLERPTAVARSEETQEFLYSIRRLWRHEILVLKKACERAGFKTYPVPQKERDLVFIEGFRK